MHYVGVKESHSLWYSSRSWAQGNFVWIPFRSRDPGPKEGREPGKGELLLLFFRAHDGSIKDLLTLLGMAFYFLDCQFAVFFLECALLV